MPSKFARRAGLILLLALAFLLLPSSLTRFGAPAPAPSPTATSLSDDQARQYRRALELAATQPEEALPILGQLAFTSTEFAEPARTLRNSIQAALLKDDPAYTLTVSGQALARLGEWELARTAFEAAVALQPGYAEAWAYLGEARQQLGQADAYAALKTAHRLDPLSLSVNLLEALYWQRQGNFARAAIPLQNAAALYPDNVTLQIQLGQNLVAAGDAPAALPILQHAIEMAPDDPETWKALTAACATGEIHLADLGLPAGHQARLLSPDDPEAETLLGRVLFLLGHPTNARAHYRHALDLDPGYAPAHLHLAIALIADGRTGEAAAHLSAVLDLAPGSAQAELARQLLDQYVY